MDLGARDVRPIDWEFDDWETGVPQGGEEFDVEDEAVFPQPWTDHPVVGAWKRFQAALGIIDMTVDECADHGGEDSSGVVAVEVPLYVAAQHLDAAGKAGVGAGLPQAVSEKTAGLGR